jgi:GDP-L-fucose synthase
MKTILLTGSSGMLGKNICEHEQFNHYKFLTPNSIEFNLLDINTVKNYFLNNKIDIIIHCAGIVGGIQANIKDPVKFLNHNLQMGLNLINTAFEFNIKHIINLGSSCMYPKDYNKKLEEKDLLASYLEPTNEGYALAKISIAKLCEYYNKQYNTRYINVIPCNLYGRWDKFNPENSHMIPSVIDKIYKAQLHNHEFVEIWGDGNSKREFMYAKDCADGIFFIIKNNIFDNYLNLGLGYDYSINEYYSIIANIIGYKGKFKHNLNKPTGMNKKLLDVNKINQYGWFPEHKLIDGIKKTFEFYLNQKEI